MRELHPPIYFLTVQSRDKSKTSSNAIRTLNHLVRKQTLSHLAELANQKTVYREIKNVTSVLYFVIYVAYAKVLTFKTKIPAYLSGKRLAFGNQRFPVRKWLLAMCRGELSATIVCLMSKCL